MKMFKNFSFKVRPQDFIKKKIDFYVFKYWKKLKNLHILFPC